MESSHRSPTGCAAGFSQHPDLAVAVGEVVGAVLEGSEPHPGLAMLFVAGPAADRLGELAQAIRSLLAPEILVATSAVGLFGGSQEIAAPSGISLLTADIDGCVPLRLDDDDPASVADQLPEDAPAGSIAVLLGGAGFRFDRLRSFLANVAPQIDVVGGGMASSVSAASANGSIGVLLNDERYDDGAVGVLIPPGVASTCGLGAVVWDDAGEEVPIVGPVEVAEAAGLVLFGESRIGLLDGPTLDFDLIFECMDGALAGMSGDSFIHPLDRSIETPAGPLHTGIVRPRATALIIE